VETCVLIAAHPDDETIGAGIWMTRYRGRLVVVHVTDGSPADPKDARDAGFETREAYARARRNEFLRAMKIAGKLEMSCLEFGFTDQRVHLHMEEFAERLRGLLTELRPELVISSPYEGGHPDHDSIAYAVSSLRSEFGFRHREHRLYHANPDGSLNTEEFLPHPDARTENVTFNDGERAWKRRMLDAFETQRRVLAQFPVGDERFRDAPKYDFSSPPHKGRLMYERWGFGVSGEAWRNCVCQPIAR
jgi:LmbE family N-acetylglucosaminyl deacetylase